jgi:RNA polymerase sigma factor (sigma-70 family)
MSNSTSRTTAPADIFATTRWTMVLTAAGEEPKARLALEELCRLYWLPLYVYVRHRGYARQDAEDLTQAFFARFLQKDYLSGLSSERGRFRAFLLASLKHFLANEWDKAQTQKRGGQLPHLSLDWHTADSEFQVAANNPITPDQAFDRQWAIALLEQVVDALRKEALAEGKERQFEQLKSFLSADKEPASYAKAARELGCQETAVRVAVHRLRKRYRQVLREEIIQTLADPNQVEEELRSLFAAFRR